MLRLFLGKAVHRALVQRNARQHQRFRETTHRRVVVRVQASGPPIDKDWLVGLIGCSPQTLGSSPRPRVLLTHAGAVVGVWGLRCLFPVPADPGGDP